MIEIIYRREVAYSQDVVLSQYFDLEHLEYVHPDSFGRARMVSTRRDSVVWELAWPPLFGCIPLRSSFRQTYCPPWGIQATIVHGFLRGTETTVQLDKTDAGTLVTERHRMAMPDWFPLRGWLHRAVTRRLDRIWEEDLAVYVCRGGWPGVPRVVNPNPSGQMIEQL